MNLAHEIPKPPKTHSTPHAPKKKQVEKRSSWRKHPKIKIHVISRWLQLILLAARRTYL